MHCAAPAARRTASEDRPFIGKAAPSIASAWWLVMLPGLAILLSTLSTNLLATGVRAITDPVQRWRWL